MKVVMEMFEYDDMKRESDELKIIKDKAYKCIDNIVYVHNGKKVDGFRDYYDKKQYNISAESATKILHDILGLTTEVVTITGVQND